MKISLQYLLIALSLSAILAIAYVWHEYVRLAETVVIESRLKLPVVERKVKIGIIGDSWAAKRKIDDYLYSELLSKGIETKIVSAGHPGAKTRLIYENLFKTGDTPFSSNHILFGTPLDLCIVLAGVNDSATYVGSGFYAHHLKLIIDALIIRGITPFIVEVPEYGIEEIDSKTIQGKVRRRIMKWVHHGGKVDVIPEYRQAAREMLRANFKEDHYLYFPFEAVSVDYKKSRDLYNDDLAHLSLSGNKKFAQEIAETINQWLSNKIRI